ncbi:MAG: response regulator [Flavobacteriaceae bacterium]|nr:response regulator [Flavobacteriaceae bacterium]
MKFKAFNCILNTLILCLSFGVWAQDEALLHLEKIEGNLSNENITSIDQDAKGYLWFGTEDGLNRYDGHHFDALRSNPERDNWLPVNYISDVAIDDGNYWLATWGGGVTLFRPESLSFNNFSSDERFNPRYILSLQKLANGKLALLSDKGVFIYDSHADEFVKIPQGQRNGLMAVYGNTLWFTNKNVLYTYDTDRMQLIYQFDAKQIIDMIAPYGKGVGVGSGNSFRYYVSGKLVKEETLSSAIKGYVQRGSTIYLHSHREIFEWSLKEWKLKRLSLESSSFTGDIKTLFIDQDELLWMGTSHGIFKERRHSKSFKESIKEIHARRIVHWNNKIYAGGLNGLFVIDSLGNKELLVPQTILSLKRFGETLWVGTEHGEVLQIQGDVVIGKTQLQTNNTGVLRVMGIERDDSSRIWVGSWEGVHVLDLSGNLLANFKLDTEIPSKEAKIIQMIRDSKDRLWIATAAFGIYCLNNVSSIPETLDNPVFINYRHDKNDLTSITTNIITTLTEDKEGTLWFGMDTGIVSFNEKENNFIRLRDGGELFDKKIMTLRSDRTNRLWISTISDGLYLYDQNGSQFFRYTVDDGLISDSFLYSSGFYVEEENLLYFGTDRGIQGIAIDRLETPALGRQVGISHIALQQQRESKSITPFNAPYVKDIHLNYNENNFSVRFSNLDYENANKVRYAYALDDEDWVVTDAQTAYFNRIPYGSHTLQVKDLYHLGGIGTPENTFQINMRIAPPWYLSWWAYVLYGIGVLALLFSIYYLLLRQRLAKSETKRTKEFDSVKSKMYANISHEFRTPLTIIHGLTDALLKDKTTDVKSRKRVTGIKRNSDQLLHLVNQMLDLVSLDVKQMQVHYKHGDFVGFVRKCVSFYKAYADSKEQELVFLVQKESLFMDIDDDKLQKVINNLLSNAIKFTPSEGKITVHVGCDEERKEAVLTVSDTGKGISEEDLPFIFDRYYKTFDTESNLGNGIGMALTKELVELLEGNIEVRSHILKGTTFKISLPIQNRASSSLSLSYKSPYVAELNLANEVPVVPLNTKKYNILLVEDNHELMAYMKELLSQKYRLFTAQNGKEGMRIAGNKKVDFIISDIMMPVMDGIEFCKTIKSRMETSHIPFVMLTAKADSQSKIEAYKIGIDAYLEKPFNSDELLAIIESLFVKNARRMKQLGSLLNLKNTLHNYKDINQLDIEFIRKIQEIALSKEVKISTDYLVNQLGTSRTQLHRKVKALTGMSITRYINQIRLEKAKELLEKSNLSVSEIAYEVGYEDTSYFSTNFKKMYKATPSSFRN